MSGGGAGDPVRVAFADGVATLTLDNPPLNLVTLEMTRTLGEALARLADDPAVRVLVVTGAGERAFCAGSSVKEFPDMMGPGVVVERKLRQENAVFTQLDRFPRPTVAAVRGLAFGGGLELAVCCDLVVAGADARFALPEVKLGVFPGAGGTVRVPRRIGEGRAKEMMFLGEPVDAGTALSWGLVNRLAPADGVLAAAHDLARALCERSPSALALCKEAVQMAFDTSEDEAIAASLPLSDRAFNSDDIREGVRAFFAKEPPRFGRREE